MAVKTCAKTCENKGESMKWLTTVGIVLLLGIYSLGSLAAYKLNFYENEDHQIIRFYGGFGDSPFKPAQVFLKQLKKNKTTHLYLERGFGGSVKEHKKFIKEIREYCQEGKCLLTTYLVGQCSSMCITLFLSGDKRIARDDSFANLGFHRTLIEIGNRRIPIQTVNGMVRYFSKFKDVNKGWLKKNRNRLFNQPENTLYHSYGLELIDAGFAHDLWPDLTQESTSFLSLFHALREGQSLQVP